MLSPGLTWSHLVSHGSARAATTWLTAFTYGNAGIMKYGGARAGDRTMLDALLPAAAAAREMITDCVPEGAAAAAAAAKSGAAETCAMTAGAGRSSYVPAVGGCVQVECSYDS
jgi:dihydroxyacetone kinase